VLDLDAYNHEVEQEKLDAAKIEAARSQSRLALSGLDLG
jgi:hypothetical protein